MGYNNHISMTAFVNDNASIKEGFMFDGGTSEFVCVIFEDLAMYCYSVTA